MDNEDGTGFCITPFIADEMRVLADCHLPDYLYHRYRYDVFPRNQELDDYPPYLQIEPTSICNYRCVFCYQTDEKFSSKKSGFMGTMGLETYKGIVDQIEGKVHFSETFKNGKRNGLSKYYNLDGIVDREGIYKNGKRGGKWKVRRFQKPILLGKRKHN